MTVLVIFGPVKSASAVAHPQDHTLGLLGLIVLAVLVVYILWPIVSWSRRRVREYLDLRRAEHQHLSRP